MSTERKVLNASQWAPQSTLVHVSVQSFSLACPAVSSSLTGDLQDLHLLRFKRREQIETVEKLRSLTDYSRQYEAVSKLLDTLFPVSHRAHTHTLSLFCIVHHVYCHIFCFAFAQHTNTQTHTCAYILRVRTELFSVCSNIMPIVEYVQYCVSFSAGLGGVIG